MNEILFAVREAKGDIGRLSEELQKISDACPLRDPLGPVGVDNYLAAGHIYHITQCDILHDYIVGLIDLASNSYGLIGNPGKSHYWCASAFHFEGRKCLGEPLDPEGYVEMEKIGATIIQLGPMRIAITKPPFSNGLEITAVRPVAKVNFDAYRHNVDLKARLKESQRGILIAGPPGSGKSTFAAGVAEYLLGCNYVVKTLESPRDLQVPPEITQYGPLEGSMEASADILLLVRPDYTIYDEVRKTRDFQVFADMRYVGVVMIPLYADTAVFSKTSFKPILSLLLALAPYRRTWHRRSPPVPPW